VSLRVRLTITAVLVVGAALVAGAFVLVSLLSSALTEQVCTGARERAREVAFQVSAESGWMVTLGTSEELVQVVDATGEVIGASEGLHSHPPIAAPGADCVTIEPPGQDDDYIVVDQPVAEPRPNGGVRVLAGRPLVDVLDSTQFVTRALLIGLPVVLLLVGATTWLVAGRMLAPVAAIRREVDEISAAELHRRVPQPRTRDEISRLSATMNRMLDRLERAQESQRRFVSDASHELRSPIATIRQHAEVALAHPDRTTLGGLAGTVLAEDLRLQQLVEDLLLLARADEQMLELPSATVDLDDLLFEEARHLRDTADLRIDTSTVSAGRVRGDRAGLRRVLRNLGDNAARHARDRIVFGLTERAGNVVLTVSDDGPGIPAAERERVFERFVRLADARSRDDGGSGLGLAIVTELVRAHGGSVRADDSHLGGARIEVRLPVTGD
jgi:signal transduction histidine kinase